MPSVLIEAQHIISTDFLTAVFLGYANNNYVWYRNTIKYNAVVPGPGMSIKLKMLPMNQLLKQTKNSNWVRKLLGQQKTYWLWVK